MRCQCRNKSLSTSSKQDPVSQIARSKGGATKASVGSRLVFGGSALIDRLWAQDSGSSLEFETSIVDATTFEAINNHWGVVG
jgi:hypothetical protein